MRTIGLDAESQDRGGLYHVEAGNTIYFLSFHARPGMRFSPQEREIILASCRWGHPERWILFGAVVMPDHVHLLLRPQPIQPRVAENKTSSSGASSRSASSRSANDPIRAPLEPRWISIGEIVKSIKGVTARQINRLRQRPGGSVWMTDYYERSVRDGEDFQVKLQYMAHNPVKAGLARSAEAWDAWWVNEEAIRMRE